MLVCFAQLCNSGVVFVLLYCAQLCSSGVVSVLVCFPAIQ